MTTIEILFKHALKNNIVSNQDEFSENHNNDKYNWILDAIQEQLAAKEKELSEVRETIDRIKDISFNSHSVGCGLEDANITDRYEAMKYGYECAIDEVNQII